MAPPTRASRKLSISIWRTMRVRDAPRARRSAISRVLPEPRTSNKLATFAQAISKTNMTAPNRRQNRRTHLADERVADRLQLHAELVVRFGIFFGEPARDSFHLRVSLRESRGLGEPAQNNQISTLAALSSLMGFLSDPHANRFENVHFFRPTEVGGQNSNNRVALPIEHDRSPEHARVRTKMRLPKRITQQQHGCRAGLLFGGIEVAPKGRLHSKHRKKIRRDRFAADGFRLVDSSQVEANTRYRRDLRELAGFAPASPGSSDTTR